MCKHSFLRALALATLLAAPMAQTALAETSEQQAMHQTATSDVDPPANLTGPYDAPAPTVGD